MKVVKKWIEIHSQSRFEAMGWVSSFPSFLALPKVTLLSELRFGFGVFRLCMGNIRFRHENCSVNSQ